MKAWSKYPWLIKGSMPVVMLLVTAATYGSAIWTARPWFGFTREWLTIMMQIEFLVIHSFAWIMLIAWFKPKTVPAKILRWTGFAAFAALYVFAAWESEGGWASVATFLGLTLVTYLGAMLHKISTGELILTGVRWFFNAFLFLFLSDKLDLPSTVNEWVGLQGVLEFGMWYFIVLAAFEAVLAWGRHFFSAIEVKSEPAS